MNKKVITLLLVAMMGLATVAIAGCDSDKGPAQKAGDKIDNAMDNQGPAEKTGEKLDQAADDVGDAVDDLTGDD